MLEEIDLHRLMYIYISMINFWQYELPAKEKIRGILCKKFQKSTNIHSIFFYRLIYLLHFIALDPSSSLDEKAQLLNGFKTRIIKCMKNSPSILKYRNSMMNVLLLY